MTRSTFAQLGLAEPLLLALRAKSYDHPTPIQEQAIPHLLAGRDLLGIAQTGTGKTAAFALPLLQRLTERPGRPAPRTVRALVLSPTRELAAQIEDSCCAYGQFLDVHVAVIFGGVGQSPQVDALRKGLDVLVATPGRLLDLMQQRHCDLSKVEFFVLDEADRMLDMGFLPDVKRVISALPRKRQSLLFSATMPNDIASLARSFLHDPVRVEVAPQATTVEKVDQKVVFVPKNDKRDLLVAVLRDPAFLRTLVFSRTKHGADKIVKFLRHAEIRAEAIHGNKSQNARERALDGFRKGSVPVLVATDIAARGIDVPEITHVINFDLPNIPESYVHRIGRTARAGRSGFSLSFCDGEERAYLRDIEKLIRQRIPVVDRAVFGDVPPGRPEREREGRPRHGDRPPVRGRAPAAPAPRAPAPVLEPFGDGLGGWGEPAATGPTQQQGQGHGRGRGPGGRRGGGGRGGGSGRGGGGHGHRQGQGQGSGSGPGRGQGHGRGQGQGQGHGQGHGQGRGHERDGGHGRSRPAGSRGGGRRRRRG